jgi:hypothetical protein
MNSFNLPDETVEFLSAGKQLSYDFKSVEPGEVKLKRFEDLVLGEVWIDTDMDGDPHQWESGRYDVPAVSLSGECKAYSPEYILLWLPNEKVFGAWDNDHGVLTVFRGASWADIVANPAPFIDAQWNPSSGVGTRFQPWPNYPFKVGYHD